MGERGVEGEGEGWIETDRNVQVVGEQPFLFGERDGKISLFVAGLARDRGSAIPCEMDMGESRREIYRDLRLLPEAAYARRR